MIKPFDDRGYSWDEFRRHLQQVHAALHDNPRLMPQLAEPRGVLRICAEAVLDNPQTQDLDDYQHPTARLANLLLAYVAAIGGADHFARLPLSPHLAGAVYCFFVLHDFEVTALDVTPAVLALAATLEGQAPDLRL